MDTAATPAKNHYASPCWGTATPVNVVFSGALTGSTLTRYQSGYAALKVGNLSVEVDVRDCKSDTEIVDLVCHYATPGLDNSDADNVKWRDLSGLTVEQATNLRQFCHVVNRPDTAVTTATRESVLEWVKRNDSVPTDGAIAYYDALVAAFMNMPVADLEALRKVDSGLSDEGREALFSVALQLAFDTRLPAPVAA